MCLVFFYLKKGLLTARQSEPEYKSTPIVDAFLFLLQDFFRQKLSLRKLVQITEDLYNLDYFSHDLVSEAPDDFMAMDLVMNIDFAFATEESKKTIEKLKSYFESKWDKLKELEEIAAYLSKKKQ